jgi:hypothetical protein
MAVRKLVLKMKDIGEQRSFWRMVSKQRNFVPLDIQIQDGFRATYFVSHLALLELMLQQEVSAGTGLIVSDKQYLPFHFI